MNTKNGARHRVRILTLTSCLVTVLGALDLGGCSDDSVGEPVCGDGICETEKGENQENCPEDCLESCGNGVAETDLGEECDGADLRGIGCVDFVGCDVGTLTCDANCRFDNSACGPCPDCGDGLAEGIEECDGSDLKDQTCQDAGCVSGTLLCDSTCHLDISQCNNCHWCGNARVDSGEECDCGLDPENLPVGCTAINGDPLGECTADCLIHTCDHEIWDPDPCDTSLPDDQCCPDDWDNPATCMPYGSFIAYCVVACTSTDDCHYNSACNTTEGGCYTYICGPSGYPGSGDLNGVCNVPGGGGGYCAPINLAQDTIGLCWENGGLAQHAQCDPYGHDVNFPRDELGLDVCNQGFCEDLNQDSVYNCVKFCDWQDVYENDPTGLVCGAGYNCFADIYFDILDPDPQKRGKRSADFAYCAPTLATEPTHGHTTCDLLNQQLISNRAQTCANVNAAYTCELLPIAGANNNLMPGGSLIGICKDAGASTPNRTLWQTCTVGVHVCPPSSACIQDDFCAGGGGSTRCIPYCDTAVATPCGQLHAALPNTNVCHSLSTIYRPDIGDCTTTDNSPSRLGLCALP